MTIEDTMTNVDRLWKDDILQNITRTQYFEDKRRGDSSFLGVCLTNGKNMLIYKNPSMYRVKNGSLITIQLIVVSFESEKQF